MTIPAYISQIKSSPETLEFGALMELISAHYTFTPTEFSNGGITNLADQNQGSCKLFAFAKLHALDKAHTLASFGVYYREDVMQNPSGDDHQNIRNFMIYGWDGIAFKGNPLTAL